MRLHRFYVGPDLELKHDFWLHDERLIHQWGKVLRMQPGQEVVLFDGVAHDRLYKILEINDREAHLEFVTDFERKFPPRDLYLAWSLLKKDKNDWVLQKCTELGVSHFVPLIADRSEKTGFNLERAKKIVIEASEQCGRSDIPSIREPMTVNTAVDDYKGKTTLFISEQFPDRIVDNENADDSSLDKWTFGINGSAGVLIGPEGGWSDEEKKLFQTEALKHLIIHDFTLRAETAAVTAVAKLLQ